MKKAKVALVSMLMLASCGLYAQTDGIGGKVTDHNGEPIIGATIKVKGSNVGAVTNIDGDFTINGKRVRDAAFFFIIMLVTFAATLLKPQKYVSSRTIQK
ncbi:MAG: carboxypeptidase-like regulatory domain-containing protein, partial [Prevotella sp.]|nr:carboxypeptidase-like regulatory domain-containing protein [Prevotella sp.]